jgi:hypothetical protein
MAFRPTAALQHLRRPRLHRPLLVKPLRRRPSPPIRTQFRPVNKPGYDLTLRQAKSLPVFFCSHFATSHCQFVNSEFATA